MDSCEDFGLVSRAVMRAPVRSSLFASTTLALSLLSSAARADPMDLALNRLSYYNDTPWVGGGVNYDPARWHFDGGCGTAATGGAMAQPFAQCYADNQLWANLVNQLGVALAPGLSAPAMTLGFSGLYVGYEVAVSNLQNTSDAWRRGSAGSVSSVVGTGTAARRDNGDPDSFVSRIHIRKGLPLGFELGTQVSHLHSSNIWAIGLDLRWSLFEGFRRGIGYLPDFAVRGSVNTMVGQSQMNLTTVGLDAMLSKRFTVGGQLRLTPFLGGQFLMILGDSGVIDFTPTRSAFAECPRQEIRYVNDTRPTTDPMRSPSGLVGQLQCGSGGQPAAAGLPGDLNDTRNSGVFAAMRIYHTRMIAGLQAQWEMFTVSGEFALDMTPPGWMRTPSTDAGRPSTAPNVMGQAAPRTPITLDDYRMWTTTIAVGLTFQ
jgi:hypothetical protein